MYRLPTIEQMECWYPDYLTDYLLPGLYPDQVRSFFDTVIELENLSGITLRFSKKRLGATCLSTRKIGGSWISHELIFGDETIWTPTELTILHEIAHTYNPAANHDGEYIGWFRMLQRRYLPDKICLFWKRHYDSIVKIWGKTPKFRYYSTQEDKLKIAKENNQDLYCV